MAAAWKLPVVFVIENNQYAIATNVCCVTGENNLYRRAIGYGIEGVQVDGFNVFEVYSHVKAAVEKARNGGGPTLIEARFMRILGHFVADDQWYRDLKTAEEFWKVCPIQRMREYFIENNVLPESRVDEIQQKAIAAIAEAIEYARHECTEPSIDTLYDDIYAHGEVIK